MFFAKYEGSISRRHGGWRLKPRLRDTLFRPAPACCMTLTYPR